MEEKPYYADLLKLCGWEENEIKQQKSRIEEAFGILGIGAEDMAHAEANVKEYYDIELIGIRKILGVFIKALLDLVLGRKEKKTIIYYSFPPIGGLGFTISMLAGEENLCISPENILEVTMGSIFDKIKPIYEAAEETGMPAGQAHCAMIQARLGAMVKGIIPLPDILFTSSFFCDNESKADEWIHETYGVPWVTTDNILDSAWGEYPSYTPERVSYLAKEIEKTQARLLEVIGKKPTKEDWASYKTAHDKFLTNLTMINEYMRADPVPASQGGIEIIRLIRNSLNHRLFPEGLEIMPILAAELEKNVREGKGPVPKGSPRVFATFMPKGYGSLTRLIERAGIAVPVTLFTYDAPLIAWAKPSTYTTFYEAQADAELKRGMFHSLYGLFYWIKEGCRFNKVDGLLWDWSYSCRPVAMTANIFKKEIENDLGIPVLSLEVDFFDERTISTEALKTRIETFTQLLQARKASK